MQLEQMQQLSKGAREEDARGVGRGGCVQPPMPSPIGACIFIGWENLGMLKFKSLQNFPSHRILRYVQGALNIDKK